MQGWKGFACFLVVAASGWAAATTSGITASPATLEFAYQVKDAALPASKNVSVNATGTLTGSQLSVQVTSVPSGWLTATPDVGRAPLTIAVSANPTGLAPGSYSGVITVNTVPPGSNPAVVHVTLSVRNPPARLNVNSTATNYTTPPPALAFNYTTGSLTMPAGAVISVASSGDTIPFTVTAAGAASSGAKSSGTSAVWPRVNGANQLPSLKTSGVALAGSSVPITVTVDPVVLATMEPGSYAGTITVAANNAANGSATVAVTLVVSAGAPAVGSVFPTTIVAGPTVNPTITIYGDNFFATSVVTLEQTGAGAPPPITLSATLLSRKVMRAVIPATAVASMGSFLIAVTNPPPPSDPSQAPAKTPFNVVSATQPAISSIVNSASFMPTAIYTGTNTNPIPSGATTVSPRELITIFGQNLGPETPEVASASGTPATFPTISSTAVRVRFTIGGAIVYAPLIMVSSNQINAIVPKEVAGVTALPDPLNRVAIEVINNSLQTPTFNVTAVDYTPGVFTFDGLGKGQAAVLNWDSATSSSVVNSSKDTASKNSAIVVYATGLGELADNTVANGALASAATGLLANTVRVDIDGQPAVVIYAGTTPGAVAGLTQINAIVPPTVKTGGAIPITVSVGPATDSRRSQASVTIGIK